MQLTDSSARQLDSAGTVNSATSLTFNIDDVFIQNMTPFYCKRAAVIYSVSLAYYPRLYPPMTT